MFAAIPFFQLAVYNIDIPGIGPLPIDPWATLVCIGFVVGLELARWRGMKLGLDVRDVVDGSVFIVLTGFVISHFFTVFFYFPERLQQDGIMALLRVWQGFSSTGGFLGAVIGAWLFYTYVRPRPILRHADVIMWGFPFGWFFGRLGCGSVHDHVGGLTSFPLAMDFDKGFGPWTDAAAWRALHNYAQVTGVRHELGLYEAALTLPIMVAFWMLGKKDRVPGYFLALFGLMYSPIRFILDFLRNADLDHQDARYLGLTPAQYGMIVMFGVALWFFYRLDDKGYDGKPLDGKASDAPEPQVS